jgi:type I restriction-modification system DNA methylase subunit
MKEQNFETALERVRNLVADFREHENHYLSPKYQEQDVRKDFIDKFWMALGWDVNHETQKNPNEQEVKVERNVGVEGRVKKADYAFLTPNFRDVRFFVEAKKPARNIDNADDYFQTIRYGWNAQCPVSILTDFEEFRVLDCRLKPDVRTAQQRALRKFHYTDYADGEKFAEIYYLFSREAAHAGALEKYAAALPRPSGRAVNRKLFGEAFKTVDEDFLQGLDELREELARSFKNRNEELNGEELTEATQRTLDRLVFMRFLEDKLIEPEVIVERLGDSSGSAWGDFVAQSARLNGIYNGIIFKPHFIDAADFVVDEKVFASVRERLAHTNTVYNFNYIPIHVLGSIYERFLGKVIVTTDKRASVVEKPEVRKAGGVYYTPEYIVRYIVAETVGRLIAGRTPAEVSEMRFADIACGSGSFLLGVFDELLRHHTAYYNRNKTARAEGKRAGCVENADGTLRLSLRQKKAILTRNIYGVDLDAQAVEVAQLSLFLRLLEDETTASARGHQLEFRETMLPDLRHNIKHGNSLIGWDIGGGLFGDEEERKLYPFDFNDAFPEVMRRGGFDAIVGNPPYVRQEMLGSIKPSLQKHYKTYHGTADLYVYFFERDIDLLKPSGMFGIIVANKWLRTNYGEPLRKWLKNQRIEEIADFGDLPVFQQATTYPCIIRVTKDTPHDSFHATQIKTLDFEMKSLANYVSETRYKVNQHALDDKGWSLTDETSQALLNKLRAIGVKLAKYVDDKVFYGLKTGLNEAFVIDAATRANLIAEDARSTELIKPFLIGRDIKRYLPSHGSSFLILMPKGWTRNRLQTAGQITTAKAWSWLSENYPAISTHLAQFKEAAEKRYDKGEFWWELRACDYYKEFEHAKIIYPNICKQPEFAFDEKSYYTNQKCFIIPQDDKYLLAILNSKVTFFLFRKLLPKLRGDFYEPSYVYFKDFPIRNINFSDKDDRARHDRMVSLVEAMLDAKRRLQTARTDRARDHYESKCAALDRQIDALVYELYELTPDEISIVEKT